MVNSMVVSWMSLHGDGECDELKCSRWG